MIIINSIIACIALHQQYDIRFEYVYRRHTCSVLDTFSFSLCSMSMHAVRQREFQGSKSGSRRRVNYSPRGRRPPSHTPWVSTDYRTHLTFCFLMLSCGGGSSKAASRGHGEGLTTLPEAGAPPSHTPWVLTNYPTHLTLFF